MTDLEARNEIHDLTKKVNKQQAQIAALAKMLKDAIMIISDEEVSYDEGKAKLDQMVEVLGVICED